jgi:hypothetical protein
VLSPDDDTHEIEWPVCGGAWEDHLPVEDHMNPQLRVEYLSEALAQADPVM